MDLDQEESERGGGDLIFFVLLLVLLFLPPLLLPLAPRPETSLDMGKDELGLGRE